MKKSISLKVFGGYVLIILALSGLILTFSFSRIRSHYEEILAQELEYLGRALSVDVSSFLQEGRTAEMDAYLKKVGKDIHARVTVIDPEGVVLADSSSDPTKMENHRYRPEVAEALEGKIGRSLRFSYTVEADMLYVGLPLERDGRIEGVLRLSLFLRTINVLLHGLTKTIGLAVAIIAVGALLLALLFSLHVVGPIRKLTGAARRVAGGDLGTKVAIRHNDEFRELGAAFNSMTGRIQKLFSDVSEQKEELARILSSLQEGLLVTDREGRIVKANERLATLFGETGLEGKFVWEAIRKPKLLELLTSGLGEGESRSEEMLVDGKRLLCTAARLGKQGGVVMTCHDLTAIRNAEVMKRDLAVNVSHELRTPIAAILGAIESLPEDDSIADKAALDILKRHAERLRLLVEDLLTLSRLEDQGFRLETRAFDVAPLAQSVLHLFAPRLKEKNIEAEVVVPPGLPALKADPYRIEQMLINLVDNALKYTDGGRIEILLRNEGREFVIAVKDTGIGIPAEHLPRIFERFYVVDKSRSRKLGGTGLGLSIVKHIAQLHGGSISVESEESRGSTFTVRLPFGAA